MIFIKIVFILSVFLIFYTFVGYPISLYVINFFMKPKEYQKNDIEPYISIIISAHNEEKVILQKLKNLTELDYPRNKYEIIIASDNSTDNTNKIVKKAIKDYKENDIYLYEVKERQGKTNAQNEAVNKAKGEILVFSDANSIIDKKAIKYLISSFINEDIIYVSGRLMYVNSLDNLTSSTESNYWNYDLFMREIESNIKTITAGNGALYAIKKNEYVHFDPIKSHDSAMPLAAALNNKKALYNSKAIAFEKAGETTNEEFQRKVRMNRIILSWIFGDFKKYNIFKYGWFSYFYFCHRTLRYSLFILHFTLLISNVILLNESVLMKIIFTLQLLFYAIALLGNKINFKSKIWYYPHYYFMTILAQSIGAKKQLFGKSKPFWEKAESTR